VAAPVITLPDKNCDMLKSLNRKKTAAVSNSLISSDITKYPNFSVLQCALLFKEPNSATSEIFLFPNLGCFHVRLPFKKD